MEVIEDVSNIRDLEEFGDAFFEYDPYDYDECELEHDIQRFILSAHDLGYIVAYNEDDNSPYSVCYRGNPPEDDSTIVLQDGEEWYWEISASEYERVFENMTKF